MHTLLRYLFLCIIGFSIIQAAAMDDEIIKKMRLKALVAQATNRALYDKLVAPCVRTENLWGLSHAVAYNPSSAQLFVAAASPTDSSGITTYRIQTYDSEKIMLSKAHIALPRYNIITALGFDRDQKPVALTANYKEVYLRCMIQPEPSILTIPNPHVVACTMTPSASVIALCYHDQMNGIRNFVIYKNNVLSSTIHSLPAQNLCGNITICALSNDGTLLACGTDEGRILVTCTMYPYTNYEFKALGACFTALSWSPNNAMLAASFTHNKKEHTPTNWCRLLCAQTGRSLHDWQTKDLVTAATFINNDALAFCTIAEKIYMYRMYLPLPVRMEPISALLYSAVRKLCRQTAARRSPLILRTQHEHDAYKLLPPLLQQPWLFTLASPVVQSDAPTAPSSDSNTIE